MNCSVTWRLAPGQRLLHRCWDGECVIYNDLSGDTHLLDEFTFELLQLLQATPHTAAALAAALGLDATDDCRQAEADADAGIDRTLLGAALDELMALHLVDHPPC